MVYSKYDKRKEIIKMTTKFFKTSDEENFYSLYVCDVTTPIPTMKEIVRRLSLSPYCENNTVKEITREEFLYLHNELLTELSDSANDMVEWAPNSGFWLHTWEWWYSEEEWEEYKD